MDYVCEEFMDHVVDNLSPSSILCFDKLSVGLWNTAILKRYSIATFILKISVDGSSEILPLVYSTDPSNVNLKNWDHKALSLDQIEFSLNPPAEHKAFTTDIQNLVVDGIAKQRLQIRLFFYNPFDQGRPRGPFLNQDAWNNSWHAVKKLMEDIPLVQTVESTGDFPLNAVIIPKAANRLIIKVLPETCENYVLEALKRPGFQDFMLDVPTSRANFIKSLLSAINERGKNAHLEIDQKAQNYIIGKQREDKTFLANCKLEYADNLHPRLVHFRWSQI
ncbi:hypothetical protein L596_030716 [Steinernema carpocapsae]|uniref:Uncharacterized protein n=1 Tax=Steinernema carpocapsae TaxID=34508 RepID=A0A4U5LNJ2_STECR|nr:hypothetical protein L596_030716 [Steinernema carpocapsae]